MEKPKRHNYNGRPHWTGSQRDMVEYLLWSNGVLRVADVTRRLASEFDLNVRQSNVCTMLKELTNRGTVNQLSRGLYQHPKSPLS